MLSCNTKRMSGYMRSMVLLTVVSMIIMLCAGCGTVSAKSADAGSIQSYRDIPGITQEEIDAIEALKNERDRFSYGCYYSTEAFTLSDGTNSGFAFKLCELMEELFDIEIDVKFRGHDELFDGIISRQIDFSGMTPRAERVGTFYMSNPISQRTIRIFGLEDSVNKTEKDTDINGLKLGFLENSSTVRLIDEYYPGLSYENIAVPNTVVAAEALESGAIDLFVVDGIVEPMFEEYGFIRSKEFFPMAFKPISLSTSNPELESFITVMSKYLAAGGVDELHDLYIEAEQEYAQYKFDKSLTEEERAWLNRRQNTPVKVGLISDYYPVAFYNETDKEYQGISIDIMKNISELTGIAFEAGNDSGTPLQTLIETLKTDDISLIPHSIYTPTMQDDFILSGISFEPASYALISKLDYPDLAIHQLARSNVGVVRGKVFENAYSTWFPDYGNLIAFATLNEAFDALDKGEIDLIMGSEYTLLTQTNYNQNSGYKINILLDAETVSNFTFNKNETMLCSIIDKALVLIKTEPIVRSWTNRNFDYSKVLAESRATFLTVFAFAMFLILSSTTYIIIRRRKYSEMHTAQKNLQTILDTMPVALRILDPSNDDILYANQACLNLYNVPKDFDPDGAPVTAFMPDIQPDGTPSREILAGLDRQGRPASAEMILTKYDGTDFDGRITTCLFEYRGKTASLGIIEDLTAEKEYLRMIENTAQKEREANQLKSSFLSNMSHEIRTPMNAIIGLTEIAFYKDLSKEELETFRKINISAKSLLQIVNDILDLSKIEADKLELYSDEFQLEEVLSSALLVVTPRLEGKRVELMLDASLDLPRFLIGDRTRLWQVLKNYLDNATKYTPEGRIVLSVNEDKERSTAETIYIAFSVTDTGIGMDEEQLQKAFRPYEQIYNDAQKRYTGTGLGMHISKRICEMMGGELDIKSEPQKGTSIRFTIPFLRTGDVQNEKDLLKPDSLSGLLIMVVEDDIYSLEIIETLLDVCGAEHVAARNGKEALEAIRSRDKGDRLFDIILLDYMMDGMNGLETAKQICLSMSGSSKLLMVTAHESSLIKDEMVACGIEDVIEKPFVPSVFINKIRVAAGLDRPDYTGPKKMQISFKDTRILVCDDNEINREVVAGVLEQFGIATVAAENGKACIDLLYGGETFDLILMDLHMPVMDGFEAARAIRRDPKFHAVPIISLTADAMTEVVDKCFEAGMDDYLAKPIEIDDISDRLLKWLPKTKHTAE